MNQHHLQVARTARYYTLGNPGAAVRQVWIVCHGYGQLAQFFLQKFRQLESEQTMVVAPEALSRFYRGGTSGRVGATWMTREDRLSEINDYVNYLDTLAAHLLQQLPAQVKIFVLGFSQGVATVCRWLANGSTRCHGLVLWSGTLPPDLEKAGFCRSLRQLPLLLAAGRADNLVPEEYAQLQHQQLLAMGLHPELHWHGNGHEIDPELLHMLNQRLLQHP